MPDAVLNVDLDIILLCFVVASFVCHKNLLKYIFDYRNFDPPSTIEVSVVPERSSMERSLPASSLLERSSSVTTSISI